MGFSYYDYYTTPVMRYVNYPLVLAISVIVAVILGLVVYFVFLKKSNEGRFHGFRKAMYNLLAFNRFYAENIIKFLYVIGACIVTITGIVMIVLGSFIAGILMLVAANIALRIAVELLLMFIMMCKKTVSMDRRLSKIENFYMENYGDDWGGEDGGFAEEEYEDDEDGCGSCGGCDIADELSDFTIRPYEESAEDAEPAKETTEE